MFALWILVKLLTITVLEVIVHFTDIGEFFFYLRWLKFLLIKVL